MVSGEFKMDSTVYRIGVGIKGRNFNYHSGTKWLEYSTAYLSAEFLLKEKIIENSKLKLNFLVGPGLNFLISSKVSGKGMVLKYKIEYDSLGIPGITTYLGEFEPSKKEKKSVNGFLGELTAGLELVYNMNAEWLVSASAFFMLLLHRLLFYRK